MDKFFIRSSPVLFPVRRGRPEQDQKEGGFRRIESAFGDVFDLVVISSAMRIYGGISGFCRISVTRETSVGCHHQILPAEFCDKFRNKLREYDFIESAACG
jgi:hypothetical protein